MDNPKARKWYEIVKYSVLHGNEQLFATIYKLYLPSEEELRAEIQTQHDRYRVRTQPWRCREKAAAHFWPGHFADLCGFSVREITCFLPLKIHIMTGL